jgi:hypothetical protein
LVAAPSGDEKRGTDIDSWSQWCEAISCGNGTSLARSVIFPNFSGRRVECCEPHYHCDNIVPRHVSRRAGRQRDIHLGGKSDRNALSPQGSLPQRARRADQGPRSFTTNQTLLRRSGPAANRRGDTRPWQIGVHRRCSSYGRAHRCTNFLSPCTDDLGHNFVRQTCIQRHDG